MDKKSKQLGMSPGTASAKLKKALMFKLVCMLGLNVCYRCNNIIEDECAFSLDHIEDWLDSKDPVGLFFDLNNIAFSHLSCNVSAAKRANKKYFTEEDRKAAIRKTNAASKRRTYDSSKRREKYLTHGY